MKIALIHPQAGFAEAEAAAQNLATAFGTALNLIRDDQPITEADAYLLASSRVVQGLKKCAAPVVVLDAGALATLQLGRPVKSTELTTGSNQKTLCAVDNEGSVPRPFSPYGVSEPFQLAHPIPQAHVLIRPMLSDDIAFAYKTEGDNGTGPRLVYLAGLKGLQTLSEDGAALILSWLQASVTVSVESEEAEVTTVPLVHSLTDEDYKRWVHEQISRGIYQRLGWLASLIGIGGVFALGAAGWAFIDMKITNKFTEQKTNMETSIGNNLEGQVTEKVATTLLQLSDVNETVKLETSKAIDQAVDAAKIDDMAKGIVLEVVNEATSQKRIDDLVEAAVNKDETLEKLVDAATEEIRFEGGIQEVILEQVRPRVTGAYASQDRGQRAAALQIMAYFEEPSAFRDALRQILISETDITGEDFEIALNEYRPSTFQNDAEVVEAIARKYAALAIADEDLTDRFDAFLASFSDAHATQLADILAEDHQGSERLLQGLMRMEGDGAVRALADLALSDLPRVSDLGWIGLAGLEDREIDLDTRVATLKRLWPEAKGDVQHPSHDLTRLNYTAKQAPAAQEFRAFVLGMVANGAMTEDDADWLLAPVARQGQLLQADVIDIRGRLDDLWADSDISEDEHSLISMVLESRGDMQLLQSLMLEQINTTDVHAILNDLRQRDELARPAFDFLKRSLERFGRDDPIRTFDAGDFLERLETVRSYDDISDAGYARLLRAVGSGGVHARRVSPDVVRSRLDALRSHMSSRAHFMLLEALETGGLDEFAELLPRHRDRMDTEAYAELSAFTLSASGFSARAFIDALEVLRFDMDDDAFFQLRDAAEFGNAEDVFRELKTSEPFMSDSAFQRLSALLSPKKEVSEAEVAVKQLRPLMIRLTRRILQLERELSSEQEDAIPIVDRTLRNRALMQLLPSAADTEVWADFISRLNEVEPDQSIKERDPMLSLLSQRTRVSLPFDEVHRSHDLVASVTLEHSDWHSASSRAGDVLVHALESGHEDQLIVHAEKLLVTGAERAEAPLAVVLTRMNEPESPDEHPRIAKELGLVDTGPESQQLYVRALSTTMRRSASWRWVSSGSAAKVTLPKLENPFQSTRSSRPGPIGALGTAESAVLEEVRLALAAAQTPEAKRDALDFAKVVSDYFVGQTEETGRAIVWLEESGIPQPLARLSTDNDAEVAARASGLLAAYQQAVTWLNIPTGPFEDLKNAPIPLQDAEDKWLRLVDHNTYEHWIKVEKGSVDLIILDEGPYRVVRRLELNEGENYEISHEQAAFVRIRPRKASGKDAPEISGDRRLRPTILELAQGEAPLPPAKIQVGTQYRVALNGTARLSVPVVAGGHYAIKASRFGGSAQPSIGVVGRNNATLTFVVSNGDQTPAVVNWIADSADPLSIELSNNQGRFDLEIEELQVDPIARAQPAAKTSEGAPRLAEVGRLLPVVIEEDAASGWINLSLDEPGLYQVESTARLEVHDSAGRVTRLEPRPQSGGSFVVSPNYFFMPEPGDISIQLSKLTDRSAELLRIQPADTVTNPAIAAVFADKEVARAADPVSLSDLASDGILFDISRGSGFALVQLEADKTYSLKNSPIVDGPLPTVEIEDSDGELIVISPNSRNFLAKGSGPYLIEITADASEGTAPFAHVVFGR